MNIDRHINEQAKKDFDEAKAKFAGFKEIDWIMPNEVIIADGALPEITQEQADKNINDAMERLYGDKDKKDDTK